ncbi:hypothetical protein ACRQ1B_22915 [Rhizobium panacihumi]|uniref:hypothetical protein n=1 Tax=Rhizobium panacihumi TaxID=2008450 RepID=UPI003D7A5E98
MEHEAPPPSDLPLKFYYEGNPVGSFEGDVIPTEPGTYRHMPFRSAGHLWMGQALREGRLVFCTYSQRGTTIRFQVMAYPAYGTLLLDNFSVLDGE